jgi:Autotransporter beta-domain
MGRCLAVAAALAVVTWSPPAWAQQCLSVGNGPACTNPAGTSVSGGANGITDNQNAFNVTNSGTIAGTAIGIFESNSPSLLVVANSGTISGDSNDGILSFGSVDVTNSGTISGGAGHTRGILAFAVDVTNSGTISGGLAGIEAGTTASISNSGTVTGGFQGISAQVVVVTNSGVISATLSQFGSPGAGISASMTAVVSNSGTITAVGLNSIGIQASTAAVTNTGVVSGGVGIQLSGGGTGSTLVNSGTVIGTGGTAIDFSNSNHDTLTFLPGSRIIGLIDLGSQDTVNFRGGAYLFTFGGPNGLTGATISAGGAPFLVSGNQVATLDPTAFGLADRALMNFTGGISSLVGNRFGSMAPVGVSAPRASSFAPGTSGIADAANEAFAGIPSLAVAYAPETPSAFKAPPFAGVGVTTVWTGAFGGARRQSADGPMLAATDRAVGAAIGVDKQIAPNLMLGGFAGGGNGRLSVDLNSQNVDTGYVFGGAYGRYEWATQFFDFTLYGGHTHNFSSRIVTNNLAPNVLETATAKYDGAFVSPDVTYGWHLPLDAGYVVTPTARLRYVAGFFDGYAEVGSAQNLSVGDRTIQDIEGRLELDVTKTTTVGSHDTLKTGLHVGAIGLGRIGDTTVNTVLLGQNLVFVTPGKASAIGGLAGGSFDFTTYRRISLFGALEGSWMSDKSTTVTAKGGLRGAF